MAAPPLLPTTHHDPTPTSRELITADIVNDIARGLNAYYVDLGLQGGVPNDVTAAAANVAAWSTALARIPSSGGTLVLNGGIFWMNTRVSITRSKVRVLAGPGCGIKLTNGANTCALTIGNLAGSPTITDVLIDGVEVDGNAANQTARGGSSWEATFGNVAIVARDVYRVAVRNCYIHDVYSTGIELNHCGQAFVIGNDVDNTGLIAVAGPRNGISCLGPATDAGFPSVGIVIANNNVRRITDVGIDAHGGGTGVVSVVGNTVQGVSATATGGWGISAEIESADTADNIGTSISGNNVDGVAIGLSIVNSQNTTRLFAAIPVIGNVISNCSVGMYVEGQHLAIHGNTLWNVKSGISTNNATTPIQSGDWSIIGNTIRMDPTVGSVFGCWGIGLRYQSNAAQRVLDGVIIEGNTMVGVGTSNQREDHSGIYLITLYDAVGPKSAAIKRVSIGVNHIHGFEHGITLNSPNAASPITDTSIRGARCWTNRSYALNFAGSGTISGTTVEGADFTNNTTGALNGATQGATANLEAVRSTRGVNPFGRLTLPRGSIVATPVASTTYTNDTNFDCTVYITGGTSVVVSIGGVSTGLAAGAFVVAAKQTINLGAFTGSPSWVWFAD